MRNSKTTRQTFNFQDGRTKKLLEIPHDFLSLFYAKSDETLKTPILIGLLMTANRLTLNNVQQQNFRSA